MILDPHRDGIWNLQELVDLANRLLPDILPKEASGRSVEDVNPRLVRHYTSIGLLPEPLKAGREARYVVDHLLRLLVVRRLLAEGYSSSAIGQVVKDKVQGDLERLLDGGVRVELVPDASSLPAAARVAFLSDLRRKAGLPSPAATRLIDNPVPMPPRGPLDPAPRDSWDMSAPGSLDEVAWWRVELLEGIELHVREDFRLPATRLGDDQIAQLVKTVLLHLEQRRKGKR